MKKKTLYKLIAFMLFSFLLLIFTIGYEFYIYSFQKSSNHSDVIETMNQSASTEDEKLTSKNTRDNTKEENSKEILTEEEIKESTEEEIKETTEGTNTKEETKANSIEEEQDFVNLSMVFTGDIYLSDSVQNKYEQAGIKGILSEELHNEIKSADIAMANEEFSFSTRGTQMKDKQYTFRVDPKYVQVFRDMQLDIVTLANNHSLDFGTDALLDSMDTLKTSNIQYVGAGENIEKAKEIRYFNVKNKTIAVLGASRVIPVAGWNAANNQPGLLTTYDATALLNEIKQAKEQSDYVVVYVHWGIERKNKPEDYQRYLAKQYIDAGADLVVGSHPHVLQGIEYYKDKPIVYSLGNFMFYNSISQTAVLKASFLENGQVQLQFIPCKADNSCTYIIDNKTAKAEFYKYMKSISYHVNFDENGIISY